MSHTLDWEDKEKRLWRNQSISEDKCRECEETNGPCVAEKKKNLCPHASPNGWKNIFTLKQKYDRYKKKFYDEKCGNVRPSPRGLKLISPLEIYEKMSGEDKEVFSEYFWHFNKEHEKYKDFLRIYRKLGSPIRSCKEIIIIGPGAPIEFNEFREPCKNEILAFIEIGFLDKLLLIGLKGDDERRPNTEKTKDVKYRMMKLLGIKESQIIRTWIDKDTPSLIPYSKEPTLILILVDGKRGTTNSDFLEALMKRRPISTIDFLGGRNFDDKSLERDLGKVIKNLRTWTQPCPMISLYRVKNR